MSTPITLRHNLDPDSFIWLWAKYVVSANLEKHCTAGLKALTVRKNNGRGTPYSQLFSKASNPYMKDSRILTMDENQNQSFKAIYLCGVAAAGYSSKKNYPHNLHAAIVNTPGETDTFEFENWSITAENGTFTRIPNEEELSREHQRLPKEYTTCRIWRWAACELNKL